MPSREETCRNASRKLLDASASLPSKRAVIGFDGFVDEIIAVVDKRDGIGDYEPIRTIERFGQKVCKVAGESCNFELVVKQMKLGGNGPIMANAMAAAGFAVTYIGAVGRPRVHPVFQEMARRAEVISISDPGHTDALEFDDGKLMLGKLDPLKDVNWENLVAIVGLDRLRKIVADCTMLGMVNWTLLPFLGQIWEKMQQEVLPHIPAGRRTLFVDLADPAKRSHESIRTAMNQLASFQEQLDVTLGLNLAESQTVATALGLAPRREEGIEEAAAEIRQKLAIGCVVIHPRRGGAAATADQTAHFAGPFVQQPKISTGAGDHFNAGFCLGRILSFGLEESLCTGVASSGYYVRHAASPSATELAGFVAELPPPEA